MNEMTTMQVLKPKNKRKLTYKNQKVILSIIFLAPWMIGLMLFFIYPFFQSLYYSFFDISAMAGGGLELTFVGIGNYDYVLNELIYKESAFRVELITTAQNIAINIPVMIIFSLFLAAMLNTQFRGRSIVRGIFFVPVILNSAAVTAVLAGSGMPAALIFEQGIASAFSLNEYLIQSGFPKDFVDFIVGLIDRIHEIITLSGVPMLLFLASIQSIPKHLYEAAKIEGATNYEMFWLITLPNVKPFIMTVIIYGVVDTFLTSSVSQMIANQLNIQNWGYATALSWLYMGVILGILLIFAIIAKIFKFGENHYE